VPGLGWAWVPGFEYAPAWVSWRVPHVGLSYLAWAPLPPRQFWQAGALVDIGYDRYNPWLFCPSAHAFSPHVSRHVLRDRQRRSQLVRETRALATEDQTAMGPSLEEAGVPKHVAPARIFSPLPASSVAPDQRDGFRRAEIPREITLADEPARPETEVRRRTSVKTRAPQERARALVRRLSSERGAPQKSKTRAERVLPEDPPERSSEGASTVPERVERPQKTPPRRARLRDRGPVRRQVPPETRVRPKRR
jgi:hypothetical protein